MNVFWILIGIICCVVGIVLFPLFKNEANKNEVDNITLKGFISSVLLVCFGIYFIAKELAKII